MMNQKKSTETITIRLTEIEKNAIVSRARNSRKSITRFVIESAVTGENKPTKEVRAILIRISELTDVVRQLDKSICERELRTPALDDIADQQKEIHSLLQRYVANGGF